MKREEIPKTSDVTLEADYLTQNRPFKAEV